MNVLELFEWASKNNVDIQIYPGRPLFIPDIIPVRLTRCSMYASTYVHIDLVYSEIAACRTDLIMEKLNEGLADLNGVIEAHRKLAQEQEKLALLAATELLTNS